MGKVRVCGKRCHNARRPRCGCWCGGIFHGAGAESARQAFREAFQVDKVPTTERVFTELTGQQDLFTDADAGTTWRRALVAAVHARRGACTSETEAGL